MIATPNTRTAGELLDALRRPFPAEACEQKGDHWYVGVAQVLDRVNDVLGFDWSFQADNITVLAAQHPTQSGAMRDGFDAVVSGHALVRYRDSDRNWQTLKRPGSDSCFMTEQGAAIKGATSGAMVKAFSTLGVGRELYGKDAPRRAELELIRLSLPRWLADPGQGGALSLNAQLKQEATTWRAENTDRRDLKGSLLSQAFRAAHGFEPTGDLSLEQKAALITEAIECRRGIRSGPEAEEQ